MPTEGMRTAQPSGSPFAVALSELPGIASSKREAHEEAALARGHDLIHEYDGRLRDALFALEQEIRDELNTSGTSWDNARVYARRLVNHVEGCWATAVLR